VIGPEGLSRVGWRQARPSSDPPSR
jgi:hypothetical protein